MKKLEFKSLYEVRDKLVIDEAVIPEKSVVMPEEELQAEPLESNEVFEEPITPVEETVEQETAPEVVAKPVVEIVEAEELNAVEEEPVLPSITEDIIFDVADVEDGSIEKNVFLDSNNILRNAKDDFAFLYIMNHDKSMAEVRKNLQANGRKVHLTWCNTLETMHESSRYDKYVFTTNTSGLFNIKCPTDDGGEEEGEVKLWVCHKCLQKLVLNTSILNKYNFNFVDHVKNYEKRVKGYTRYQRLPAKNETQLPEWFDIRDKYIKSKNYTCECCNIKCEGENEYLLDVYHIDGNPLNVEENNLVCLCRECHRVNPTYRDFTVAIHDIEAIRHLRGEQDI